jgi:hypothetical protein
MVFAGIWNKLKQPLVKAVNSIGDGAKRIANDVFDSIEDEIGKPIVSIGDEFKKIPNKVFKPIGNFVKENIRDPIMDLIDGIDDMIANFIRIICFLKATPSRFRNLGSAFDEVFNGITQEFVSLGYAFELGFDSIASLVYYTAIFVDTYLSCFIKILSNSLECLPFYLIDVIGQILYLPVRILLWIFYTFLGFDLYPNEKKTWNRIMALDEIIYVATGFHIAKYPSDVTNNCYTCIVLKESVLKDRKNNVDTTFKKKIPEQLGKSKPIFDKAKRHFNEVFAYPHAREPEFV